MLFENVKGRTFYYVKDPELDALKKALNQSMIASAKEGYCSGLMKKKRSDVIPEHVKKILMLFNNGSPAHIECAFGKVRKTAFFMKIDPAPFSDFGAAEGGTVMPKKIWRRRRRQNH